MEFINLKLQYQKYKSEIDAEIQGVLDSSEYIGGRVSALEKELASYTGCNHAIACSSGTDALLLALMALDIGSGDEVITTPFTFISSASMISFVGAKPVFVDIDERTYNIDVTEIEKKINQKTKAIMPVSLFGQVANMDEINALAKQYQLKVIEDAAQSFGALYKGKKSCNVSDIGTTSFFPAKPLGCYGDGGAIFTNDDELAKKIRTLLNHGQTEKYKYECIGINGRLDSIQASVLLVKLKYFDQEIQQRQKIADQYNSNLKNVVLPFIEKHNTSVWAQYCILSEDRGSLQKKCLEKGIPTAIYYPTPLHLQNAFRYLQYQAGDFPIAERMSKKIIAIPMSAFLNQTEQQFIIETVNA